MPGNAKIPKFIFWPYLVSSFTIYSQDNAELIACCNQLQLLQSVSLQNKFVRRNILKIVQIGSISQRENFQFFENF